MIGCALHIHVYPHKVQTELSADSKTRAFGEYVTKHYTKNPEEWASCHRQVRKCMDASNSVIHNIS